MGRRMWEREGKERISSAFPNTVPLYVSSYVCVPLAAFACTQTELVSNALSLRRAIIKDGKMGSVGEGERGGGGEGNSEQSKRKREEK